MSSIRPESRDALLRYEKSLDCIHCGLCLQECPTYRQTGNEVAGPRGRIYLMRGLAEGELELTDNFREQMDLCLVCRACETICPSGVAFSQMMEVTRHEMASAPSGSRFGRMVRRFLLNGIVPKPKRLAALATIMRFFDKSGLRGTLRAIGITSRLPATLQSMEQQMPAIPPRCDRRPLRDRYDASPDVPSRGTVWMLEGCVMRPLFGEVNRNTVEALTSQGYEVLVPRSQTCCGALHAHAGDLESARDLARRNIEAFEKAETIILNSAGCGAAMHDYAHLLAADPDWSSRASAASAKVVDVMSFFAREGLAPRGRSGSTRVTYDAPCHLHHAQKDTTRPLDVIAEMPGVEFIPLPHADHCCGAAGIYNLTHADMSRAILEEKLDALASLEVDVLFTGNPGCMMQWQKGIAERGLQVSVEHPATWL